MIAYLDCSSGISGDMLIGALVDTGISPSELAKVFPFHVEIIPHEVYRAGIKAVHIEIITRNKRLHSLDDFKMIIDKAELSDGLKEKAKQILYQLFKVEAGVHGVAIENLHLHELGSIDTIIDIIATLRGFQILGIEEIYCSPINTGRGFVQTEHGVLAIPTPATAELLKDFVIFSSGPEYELTTPTGAAILRELAKPSLIPSMKLLKIGYGAGSGDFKDWPNLLRVFIGEKPNIPEDLIIEKDIYVLESNIDDMNPQVYEHLIELLFEQGALDVFIENIIMKKSRPAQKLSVLCREISIINLVETILKETTTLGVRFYRVERLSIPRKISDLTTSLGKVRLKIAEFKGTKRFIPEYEDLKRIAKETGFPLSEVSERIKREILNTLS